MLPLRIETLTGRFLLWCVVSQFPAALPRAPLFLDELPRAGAEVIETGIMNTFQLLDCNFSGAFRRAAAARFNRLCAHLLFRCCHLPLLLKELLAILFAVWNKL